MKSGIAMLVVGIAAAMFSTSFLLGSYYYQEARAQGEWSGKEVCVDGGGNMIPDERCLPGSGCATCHMICVPVNPGGQGAAPRGGPGSQQQCN